MFKAVADKAGIKNAKLHDLRKTYATMLANHKVHKIFIQGSLGHAPGSEVTANDYIGSIDDKMQAELNSAVSALADRFKPMIEKNKKKIEQLDARIEREKKKAG
jgi:integrase